MISYHHIKGDTKGTQHTCTVSLSPPIVSLTHEHTLTQAHSHTSTPSQTHTHTYTRHIHRCTCTHIHTLAHLWCNSFEEWKVQESDLGLRRRIISHKKSILLNQMANRWLKLTDEKSHYAYSVQSCTHTYCYLFSRYSSEVKDCPVVAVCSDQSRAAWSVGVFRGTLAAKTRLYG